MHNIPGISQPLYDDSASKNSNEDSPSHSKASASSNEESTMSTAQGLPNDQPVVDTSHYDVPTGGNAPAPHITGPGMDQSGLFPHYVHPVSSQPVANGHISNRKVEENPYDMPTSLKAENSTPTQKPLNNGYLTPLNDVNVAITQNNPSSEDTMSFENEEYMKTTSDDMSSSFDNDRNLLLGDGPISDPSYA